MLSLKAEQFRDIDQAAVSKGVSVETLMSRAASQVYAVMKKKRIDKRVLIICGSGNNGGDGFALAAIHHQQFESVKIVYPSDHEPTSVAAKYFYEQCKQLNLFISSEQAIVSLHEYDVIVDAMFGTGLSRTVKEPYASLIHYINASNHFVLAVDVPSGINSDDGHVMGVAIKADLTVTFVRSKPGLWLYPGSQYAGKMLVSDIGITIHDEDYLDHSLQIIDEEALCQRLPNRSLHSHKGSYGKLLGIGGSSQMGGAIFMAAEAALRSGCGMCTVAVPSIIQPQVCTYLPELMSIALPQNGLNMIEEAVTLMESQLSAYDVIFAGNGAGRSDAVRSMIKLVLSTNQPCVIDGDGIYALQNLNKALSKRDHIVVTPHLKEMTYLIDWKLEDIIEHPQQAADCFCETYPNVVLVLKSERPLIAYKQSRWLCVQGNDALAKGGSGDVLCGMIASFMGQGLSPIDSAVLGCGVHASCAKETVKTHSSRFVLPRDIIHTLDEVFQRLEKASSINIHNPLADQTTTLLRCVDQIHTTDLGAERIKRNLKLDVDDVVAWCKAVIQDPNSVITRNGKNWYIEKNEQIITVNAHSYTIITAHKVKTKKY